MVSENIQAWRWQLVNTANPPVPVQSSATTDPKPDPLALNDALYHHIFVWFDLATPVARNRINGDLNNSATPIPEPSIDMNSSRPSSRHPGGVNMFFAGGNLKFIAEDLEYLVYRQLMTPSSSQATNVSNQSLLPLNDGSF
jgi:prepilin-type processing-associated H-X9-DG protein